jgi:hypothetical protein
VAQGDSVFRIQHLYNFNVSRSVLSILFEVVILINKLANRVCEEIYTQFAKSSAVAVLFGILVLGSSLGAMRLAGK